MRFKISEFIQNDEKKIMWNEAVVFATKKKQGLIKCRCKPFFYESDSNIDTMNKIRAHACFRYTGNIIELCIKRWLQSQNKSFKDNVYLNGSKSDVDFLFDNGIKLEVKGSATRTYMFVNENNINQGDVFIMCFLDKKKRTIRLVGWCRRNEIINEKNKKGDGYLLSEYKLNKDFNKLLNML